MKTKIILLLFIFISCSNIIFSKNCELQTFVGTTAYQGNENDLEITIAAGDTINVYFTYWGNCFMGPCAMYDGQWFKNGVFVSSGSAINITTPGYYVGTVKMEGCYNQQSSGIVKLNVKPVSTSPYKIFPIASGSCFGDTSILSVQNASSYLWSNGNTTQNINVFQDGVYNVTVLDSNGNSFTTPDTFMHFMFSPNVSFTVSSDTICISSEVKPVLNPDWNNEYHWMIDDAIQNRMQGNASVARATITGQYKIVVNNACGSDSASIDVFIPPSNLYINPAFATVCANDSVHLTPSIPGSNYIWMNNSVPIPGATNADYYATFDGSITVKLTDVFGCDLTSYYTNINVDYQTISLGADKIICPGATVTIDAPPGFGYYYWQDSTMGTSYIVTTPGVYSLSVVDAGQCTLRDSIIVDAYPLLPITLGNDTTICNSQTIILDAGPGFQSYEWNDSIVSRIHIATYLGQGYETVNYNVTTIDWNGCIESDSIRVVFDVCSSVNSIDNSEKIKLIPISENKFLISQDANKLKGNIRIRIFDNSGKIIFDEIVADKQIIELKKMSAGIYVYNVSENENVVLQGKLVIQ